MKSVMVDPDGHEVKGDKFIEGAKSILVPSGKKKTQKITKHFINDEWVSLCREIYGFYHEQEGGGGKNNYEIDTCEI